MLAHVGISARCDASFPSVIDFSWTLKNGGETLFEMPKLAVIKGFVINHTIHHRGQLSVYLRLCGLPVPQTYGPTADEPSM